MDVFDEFKQLLTEFVAFLHRELTPRIAATLGAALVTLIIGLAVLHKRSSKKYVSRRVKKALAMGHILTARCVKSWEMTDDRFDVTAKRNAIYEYCCDGQTYRYHYLERKIPPATIQLYYLNDPKHAFIQKDRSCLHALAVLVSVLLVGGLVAFLTK